MSAEAPKWPRSGARLLYFLAGTGDLSGRGAVVGSLQIPAKQELQISNFNYNKNN